MSQTILMATAALQFVVVACFVNATTPLNIAVFKVYSLVLAFGLGCMAFGRFMGWPM